MPTSTLSLQIPDEAAMLQWAGQLAQLLPTTMIIHLVGDLGAGKTTLVRGFLRGLGYTGRVKSPTYTLVESYSINERWIHHFDLYRIQNDQELEFLGLPEYSGRDSLCFVEWPRGDKLAPDWIIHIEPIDHTGTGRQLTISAQSAIGQEIFIEYSNAAAANK